jgi:hypothetical protein
MTLATVWRRGVYGGLVAAALVPAALLVALLAAAFVGGFAPLGVVVQAVSGPTVPASAPAGARAPAARALPSAALAALAATASAASAAAPVRGGSRAGTVPAVSRQGASPTRLADRIARPPASSRRRGGHGGSTGTGAPPPARQQTVVDQIVGAATAVTSQLPGPAGPLATGTLEAVGSTADGVLPPGSLTPPGAPKLR